MDIGCGARSQEIGRMTFTNCAINVVHRRGPIRLWLVGPAMPYGGNRGHGCWIILKRRAVSDECTTSRMGQNIYGGTHE